MFCFPWANARLPLKIDITIILFIDKHVNRALWIFCFCAKCQSGTASSAIPLSLTLKFYLVYTNVNVKVKVVKPSALSTVMFSLCSFRMVLTM